MQASLPIASNTWKIINILWRNKKALHAIFIPIFLCLLSQSHPPRLEKKYFINKIIQEFKQITILKKKKKTFGHDTEILFHFLLRKKEVNNSLINLGNFKDKDSMAYDWIQLLQILEVVGGNDRIEHETEKSEFI